MGLFRKKAREVDPHFLEDYISRCLEYHFNLDRLTARGWAKKVTNDLINTYIIQERNLE